MSLAIINTEIKDLSYIDKLQLLQNLIQEIIQEEILTSKSNTLGQGAADILQRMADRNALSHISDPVEWQNEIRQDHILPGRN